MNMKFTLSVALLALAIFGCNEKPPNSTPTTQQSGSIGSQFQAYELPEYSLQETDVLHGMGGRWMSLRYVLKSEESLTPADVRARIQSGLERNGWEQKPLPDRRYVLSTIFETSPDDLYYSHGPFDGDRDHWFYNQAIHVSNDGRTVVCYYEVGW